MNERRKVLELFEAQKDLIAERAKAIETYRKGDAQITITDDQGNPLTGARVKISQTSHQFRYGANLFLLEELETEEKNRAYKEAMAGFCNMATLPFYWSTLEPERGKPRYAKDSPKVYRRPAIDLCMEFCEENGIEPREHALCYNHFFPKWLYDASIEEEKKALENRFREIAERYANRIPTIEVTNEMEWEKGATDFYNDPDYILWCFQMAEKYFPNNQLGINEWHGCCWADRCRSTDKYYSYIQANMLRGARIDAIGMQYHMFYPRTEEYTQTRKFYDPDNLYRHMDLYAGLGKPLQITEITVPAYSNDPEDEAIQAEILEYLYTIWFSHPSVEQIIYWNMVDGYAYVASDDPMAIKASQGNMTTGENVYYGGLLRFDMTPKPAYHAIRNLFEKKWHTEEVCVTDEKGNLSFRGFYGSYTLELLHNGKTITREITLSSKSDNRITVTA